MIFSWTGEGVKEKEFDKTVSCYQKYMTIGNDNLLYGTIVKDGLRYRIKRLFYSPTVNSCIVIGTSDDADITFDLFSFETLNYNKVIEQENSSTQSLPEAGYEERIRNILEAEKTRRQLEEDSQELQTN